MLTCPTLRPQLEVENYYTCEGYLLPSFHQAYWIGLNSSLLPRPPPPPLAGLAPPPSPPPTPPPAGGVLGPHVGLPGSELRNFTWLDPEAPAFWNASLGRYMLADSDVVAAAAAAGDPGFWAPYQHWGVTFPDGVPEPNGFQWGDAEGCAVANASEAYLQDKNPWQVVPWGAWGWSDTACDGAFVGMCRIQGGRSLPGCLPCTFACTCTCLRVCKIASLPCKMQAQGLTVPLGSAAVPGPKLLYNSPTTQNGYYLNTSATSFAGAQQACAANGGNLASFGSYQEQLELEAWLLSSHQLFPAFHKVYWIGLNTSSQQWPRFSWLDGTAAPLEPAYSAWGALYYPVQVGGEEAPADAPCSCHGLCNTADLQQAAGSLDRPLFS